MVTPFERTSRTGWGPSARNATRIRCGPIIGAVVLGVTQQALTVTISSEVNVLVLGMMLVFFVVAAPEGILGLLRRLRALLLGRGAR